MDPLIEHRSTKEWITALGMDRFPSKDKGSWLDWQPGKLDLKWDRTIAKIDGDTITLDAPITSALDAKLSAAKVSAVYAGDPSCTASAAIAPRSACTSTICSARIVATTTP